MASESNEYCKMSSQTACLLIRRYNTSVVECLLTWFVYIKQTGKFCKRFILNCKCISNFSLIVSRRGQVEVGWTTQSASHWELNYPFISASNCARLSNYYHHIASGYLGLNSNNFEQFSKILRRDVISYCCIESISYLLFYFIISKQNFSQNHKT